MGSDESTEPPSGIPTALCADGILIRESDELADSLERFSEEVDSGYVFLLVQGCIVTASSRLASESCCVCGRGVHFLRVVVYQGLTAAPR